jgi:hypothetical protein
VLGRGVHASADAGETWRRIDDGNVIGAYWYAHALQIDPFEQAGRQAPARLAAFMKDPPEDPLRSAITLDAGRTWQPISRVMQDRKLHSYGWSWGLVDWSSPEPNFMIAKMHHSARMWRTRDGGASWTELPLVTDAMGMYDRGNLVACDQRKGAVYHSADEGRTWHKTDRFTVTQWVPVRHGEKLYWVVDEGLMVSADKGKSWKRTGGKIAGAHWGPLFGPTEREIVIVALDGVYRSDNAGESWQRVAGNHAIEAHRSYGTEKFRFDWFVGETSWAWDHRNDKLYCAVPGRLFVTDLPAANPTP